MRWYCGEDSFIYSSLEYLWTVLTRFSSTNVCLLAVVACVWKLLHFGGDSTNTQMLIYFGGCVILSLMYEDNNCWEMFFSAMGLPIRGEESIIFSVKGAIFFTISKLFSHLFFTLSSLCSRWCVQYVRCIAYSIAPAFCLLRIVWIIWFIWLFNTSLLWLLAWTLA